MKLLRTLWHFGWLEAMCCIFPVIIFMTLALSKLIEVPYLYRYDLILLVCVAAQVLLIYWKFETVDEFKVIMLFHLIGLGLELYKVRMGSWAYPEEAWSKVGGVPLYSGFMYASVASYICQAWRRMKLNFSYWPNMYVAYAIAALIYVNFFTHHVLVDIRYILIISLFIVFRRTSVQFTITTKRYEMPLFLSFILIAFFIWLGENISTYLGAWKYPNQTTSWNWVHLGKISSWFLLVIITIILVAQLKFIKYRRRPKQAIKRVGSLTNGNFRR